MVRPRPLGRGLIYEGDKMASTHVTMVCDRTGSMASIQNDAEGAVNSFLDEQKLVEGECSLWLIDFDSPDYADKDWFRTVYEGAIKSAPKYHLAPRGNTALFDALAQAIRKTGDKLNAMRDADKPERVLFIWQTDGLENASKETTLEQLQQMIKHQEDVYSWVFIPLGSTLDAAKANSDILWGTQSAGNLVAAAGTGHSHSVAHSHVSSTVSNLRSAHSHEAYAAASYGNAAKFNEKGERLDDEGNVIPSSAGSNHLNV
jgi:hypothetical protein